MITTDDVLRSALALPETAQATHFRLPSVQVKGKDFVVVRTRNNTGLMLVSESDALAAIAEDPAVFEEERKSGKLRGVWVRLESVKPERLEQLIELAWRNKAPKTLIDESDTNR